MHRAPKGNKQADVNRGASEPGAEAREGPEEQHVLAAALGADEDERLHALHPRQQHVLVALHAGGADHRPALGAEIVVGQLLRLVERVELLVSRPYEYALVRHYGRGRHGVISRKVPQLRSIRCVERVQPMPPDTSDPNCKGTSEGSFSAVSTPKLAMESSLAIARRYLHKTILQNFIASPNFHEF